MTEHEDFESLSKVLRRRVASVQLDDATDQEKEERQCHGLIRCPTRQCWSSRQSSKCTPQGVNSQIHNFPDESENQETSLLFSRRYADVVLWR